MDIEVQIDSAAFSGALTFTKATVVTQTPTTIVVALANDADERIVLTLPKSVLAQLGNWQMLF